MCDTCKDRPLFGCATFGCKPGVTCFITCPECGQEGFGSKPEQFDPDMELAALLVEARDSWKVTA